MFVYLRLTLNTTPDAAWEALRNPQVFRQVNAPLMRVTSLEKGGFPAHWVEGQEHRISVRLLGIFPLGTQAIHLSFGERPGGVRMVIDRGTGLSGALGMIRKWDHRMAVSATDDGRTLYRDRLAVRAGAFTPFVWMAMWTAWQIRAERLKQVARTWSEPGAGQVPHTD